MANKVRVGTEEYNSITPHLIVDDGAAAIVFYKKAFGGEELFRMAGPNGRAAHAEMQLGSSR